MWFQMELKQDYPLYVCAQRKSNKCHLKDILKVYDSDCQYEMWICHGEMVDQAMGDGNLNDKWNIACVLTCIIHIRRFEFYINVKFYA